MSLKVKIRPWILTFASASILIGLAWIFLMKYSIGYGKIINHEESKNTKGTSFNKTQDVLSSFKELDIRKEEFSFTLEGVSLNFTLPIYSDANRVYLPITEMALITGGSQNMENNKVQVKIKDRYLTVDINTNTVVIGNEVCKLRYKILMSGEVMYVSLIDLTKLLDLKTDWNHYKKLISLFYNKEHLYTTPAIQSDKIAFLRLEDFCISDFRSEEKLSKLRIISDFCYRKAVPFHVAWIPRGVIPPNFDVDISRDYNIENADFLFTLDYFLERGGIIGLHGYTHQHDNEISGIGTEFSGSINSSPQVTRERIEKAIEIASILHLPIGFFESPHYSAAPHQLKIMEDYFDIMYQPKDKKNITKVASGNREILYIPTPLNYVANKKDADRMIRDVDKLDPNSPASFFFHPNLEMEFISITKDTDGYPVYNYFDNSILHKLINKIQSTGFKFESVTMIK